MRPIVGFVFAISLCVAGAWCGVPPSAFPSEAAVSGTGLSQVKRIYVARLTGGAAADALRELIISGIDGTKLFVLTENEGKADAVLKGAADDHAFEDTHDSSEGGSSRENGGKFGSGTSGFNRSGGGYLSVAGAASESHHIKERKHEAYATVRLCDRNGDVLWSTTQESQGAKFRGASADVAAKIARQLSFDMEHQSQALRPAAATR